MPENDLISRSALIAEHCDGCVAIAWGQCNHDVCGAAQLIMEAPTVDAVEVVRCKDCKFFFEDDFDGSLWCCRDKEVEVVETHFCSYGERRAEE